MFWLRRGSVISVSEVLKELNNYATRPHLAVWLIEHCKI